MNTHGWTFRAFGYIVDIRIKRGVRRGVRHFAVGVTWARKAVA